MTNADRQGNNAVSLTWQQTKSQNTRSIILDAAVGVIYDVGYANTTTEAIARRAAVSRGAMLHHFPTRLALMEATINHIHQQRLHMFSSEEQAVQQGAEYSRVEEGIDAYWRQLNTPEFVVFQELKMAARTDSQLAEVLMPALNEFQSAWYEATKQLFPDLAMSEAFERANALTAYLLEGMAAARALNEDNVPVDMMLEWLKRELRRSFHDVLGTIPRKTERTT